MSDTDLKSQILEMGKQSRAAALRLATLSTDTKNRVLLAMADAIETAEAAILEANALDVAAARERGLSAAMIDRLTLTPDRVAAIADGVRQVAGLPDPVGEILAEWDRPNGIRLAKKRVPIGSIGIIFESRPNVTSDAAVLCFKSGNATILRGGSEAIHSNQAIARALCEGGKSAGMPDHSIQLIPVTTRESVRYLAEMDGYLDLIIPRGGKGLIETVVALARMPVIKHYDGICHVYVDSEADLEMAAEIVVNSKCQKPSVCNALETLLVHRDVADDFYAKVAPVLLERGVELRGDAGFRKVIAEAGEVGEDDWTTEYLDLVLAIKTVSSCGDAINHINCYGSRHSDCIVTGNRETAETFLAQVDSATVFWNVSTRFSDGEEFGFGAEIGISTDKLHARGPMALPELCSYKYLVTGNGQIK